MKNTKLDRILVDKARRMFPPSKYTYTYDSVEIIHSQTFYINFKAEPKKDSEKSPLPDGFLKTKEENYPWGKYIEGFVPFNKGYKAKKYIILSDNPSTVMEVF